MIGISKPRRIQDKKQRDLTNRKPCLVCGRKSDAAHVKSVGSGGDDVEENLIPLCREHHSAQHWGWTKFLKKYPQVLWRLEEKGWTLETLFGRTRLVRK